MELEEVVAVVPVLAVVDAVADLRAAPRQSRVRDGWEVAAQGNPRPEQGVELGGSTGWAGVWWGAQHTGAPTSGTSVEFAGCRVHRQLDANTTRMQRVTRTCRLCTGHDVRACTHGDPLLLSSWDERGHR